MTLAILAALPVSVLAFNNFRYGKSQASSDGKITVVPGGPHYNLNLIGIPKGITTDMQFDEGRRLFVPLSGKAKIILSRGDYRVTDANGTDGMAGFSLPGSDLDMDGVTDYAVWVKWLGKPGLRSTMTTCANDPVDGETFCSVYQLISIRERDGSATSDVSRDLLYIYADLNGDGTSERYNLFDSALQDYFWEYDNEGIKLIQLRFYEMPSTTSS